VLVSAQAAWVALGLAFTGAPSSERSGKKKTGLDPTQAHMNHVHIELNLRGAAKKTTFWNQRTSYPVQDQTLPVPPTQPATPAEPVPANTTRPHGRQPVRQHRRHVRPGPALAAARNLPPGITVA
jgi:hypothetical protein